MWMRGAYKANQGEWYSSVVAAIIPPRRESTEGTERTDPTRYAAHRPICARQR